MHKPNIPTVYNAAPPSYMEAMGQSASTTHVPTSTQYQSTTYPQVHSQSFIYPTATTYAYPNQEARSCIPVQSPYNSSYITANQQDQSASTSYIINATVVAPTNATVRNNTKRKIWMVCVFIIWFIIIIIIFSNVFR